MDQQPLGVRAMNRTGVLVEPKAEVGVGTARRGEVIRVALADREEIFREGLAKLLNDQPHIEVVCQCRDAEELVEQARQEEPDVILLDSQIAGNNVGELLASIAECLPMAKAVVVTHPETPVHAIDMLKAGAKACFAKTISVPDLVRSIELVSTGRIIISPVLAGEFVDQIGLLRKDEESEVLEEASHLSVRETEITKLISQGATNKEIAGRLLISDGTVKVHVKNILRKLDLRNRQQLAVYAFMRHWVSAIDRVEDEDQPSGARFCPEGSTRQNEQLVAERGIV